MSARIVGWSLGFLGGVALAAVVPESLFAGVRPVVLAATFLMAGLLGEWAHSRRARHVGSHRRQPRDTRPADGLVEIAAVPGVQRTLNSRDPRFGRFMTFQAEARAEAAPLPAGLRRGPRSSPPLLGRVTLVSLFSGHDRRCWTDAEIARVHEALVRAGGWVEREAQRWGVAVNVEVADTYFEAGGEGADDVAIVFDYQGDEVVTMEENAEHKALAAATRIAVGHGFRDAEHLVRTVEDRLGADATVWLLHPLRAGGSLALTAERPQALLEGVNLAICYAREAPFPEPLTGLVQTDPVSVVHEMLHLFGATDKYGRSIRDYAPRAVTSREVMRLDETRLSRLRVDPQTAIEIGWASPEKATAAASRDSRRPSVIQGDDIKS